MTRKQRFKKLGWRTEKILADRDGDGYKKGEWYGYWRLVAPDGVPRNGWYRQDKDGLFWTYNCFDGEVEAWAFAGD